MWANALQNSGLENFADAFGVNRSVNEGGGAIRPGMHLQAIVPIRGPRGSRTSRFLHRFSSDPPSIPCVSPPRCLAPTLDVLTCAKSVSARARSHCLWSLNLSQRRRCRNSSAHVLIQLVTCNFALIARIHCLVIRAKLSVFKTLKARVLSVTTCSARTFAASACEA